MEKVLVLGGAGYVGSVLTANLLNDGFFVRSLDNFLYQNNHCVLPWIGNTNFEFLNRDLIDASSLDGVFEGVSSVIILAGMAIPANIITDETPSNTPSNELASIKSRFKNSKFVFPIHGKTQ